MRKTLWVQPRQEQAKNQVFNEMLKERDSFVGTFDQIFDEMLKLQFPEAIREMGANPIGRAAYPKVNVIATKDAVTIESELAGFTKDNIDLDIKEHVLTISGKAVQQETETEEGQVYIIRELKRSSFSRSFILSKELDTSKINATFENGLLTITIPKFTREESTPVKVTIK